MEKIIKLVNTENSRNKMEAIYCICHALGLKNKEITQTIVMKGGVEAICYALKYETHLAILAVILG